MVVKITSRILAIITIFTFSLYGKVIVQFIIQPYTQVYSENLPGASVLFGNTSMNIVDADTISISKISETADPLNNAGGLGYRNYGNDFENMQFTDIDINA